MRLKTISAATVLSGMAIAAGCSSDSPPSQGLPAATQKGPVAAAADYASPQDVINALRAKGIACGNPQEAPKAALTLQGLPFADAATRCESAGTSFVIATFKTPEQRVNYVSLLETGRGAYPHAVLGTTWAVAVFKTTDGQRIANAIGGAVH